ncbi:MAG: PD-(D/E)XK motif protein [Phycisphaerales bacterium]
MEDLIALFMELGTPVPSASGEEAYSVTPIPGRMRWHIGRNRAGLPAVLVATESERRHGRPLAVGLENLRIEHNVQCRLIRPDSEASVSRYSVLQCLAADDDVQFCFLRTIAGALAGFEDQVEAGALTSLVDRLVTLFRLVRQPRVQTIRGLWAELLVILTAQEPALMIDAWHSDPVERFDFSQRDQRVEVKSNSARSRNHVFSFEQVYPPSGASVLIASVFVEDQTNGVTLAELWDRATDCARDSDGRLKIERVCAEYLGEDLATGRASAFDWDVASDSLAFFAVQDIPRPPAAMPGGVSQIQFASDLSLSEAVVLNDLDRDAALHRCCVTKA